MSLHVHLCEACAAKVGLHETFLMIVSARPCEGCGATIGYECSTEWVPCDGGGAVSLPRLGRLIARCMQMWRNEMWPVAFGISLQDFAGVHRHEWRWTYCNNQTGEVREQCRCGGKRTRFEPTGASPSRPA